MTKQGVRRFFMLWIQAAIRIEQRLESGTHRLHQRVRQNGRINPQILESDLESLNSLRQDATIPSARGKGYGLGPSRRKHGFVAPKSPSQHDAAPPETRRFAPSGQATQSKPIAVINPAVIKSSRHDRTEPPNLETLLHQSSLGKRSEILFPVNVATQPTVLLNQRTAQNAGWLPISNQCFVPAGTRIKSPRSHSVSSTSAPRCRQNNPRPSTKNRTSSSAWVCSARNLLRKATRSG